MSLEDPNYKDADSPTVTTSLRGESGTHPDEAPPRTDAPADAESPAPASRGAGRRMRIVRLGFVLLVLLAGAAFFFTRHPFRTEMRANLPQLDGSLRVFGLSAPVTVECDARGVPHIRANSLDDLVFAQGYITAQDRLWQMDLLRRHAAGTLAAILGRTMLEHDRLQRTLQLRATADRAAAALPADQKH